MLKLSVSSAATWRDCRQRYQYKHVECLRAKGPRPIPLERGTIIHEFLNGHHVRGNWLPEYTQRQEWFSKLFQEERDAYGVTLIEDCGRVVQGWKDKYDESDPLETVLAEQDFEIELEDCILRGRIDWLARRKSDGTMWLVEHKTFKANRPGEAERLSDLQTAVYLRAVEKMGYGTPTGVMHDYLRSVPPQEPRLLQGKRGLSRAKDVITDYATLMSVIERHGLDPEDYSEELTRASATTFYERRYLARPPAIVDAALQELYRQVVDMKAGVVYRNISKDCGGCEYNALCEAELFGLDVEYVKKSEYRQRTQ